MLDTVLASMTTVVGAKTPDAASLAFFEVARSYGATYLQTRLYHRPSGVLTPATHLQAGGVVARVAPETWPASQAFKYVCLDCNPLVEAVRTGLTRYRFSDFAPRESPSYGAYWEAMSEAGIADAVCATAYGRARRIASLHLGFGTAAIEPERERALHLVGMVLVETLLRFDDGLADPPSGAALTPRERDAMWFVAEGKTDWEIATIFGVSETTARFHVDNARRKLGAVNRAHAVAQLLGSGELH